MNKQEILAELRQYDHFDVKRPRCLPPFRVGDFYEACDADADTAGGVLDPPVTPIRASRASGSGRRVVGLPEDSPDSRCLPKNCLSPDPGISSF